MTVEEVTRLLQKDVPLQAAEAWDHVGLLVGDPQAEVTKILVAMDATEEIIDRAKEAGVSLLVTHHPLLFHPLSSVTEDDPAGRRVLTLAREGIACYAAHTNFDVLRMGQLAADQLKMEDARPFLEGENGQGMGRIGMLPEAVTLKTLAETVCRTFGLSHVRTYGRTDRMVQYAAILPGSGRHEVARAVELEADVYITGDVDHHSGLDAVASGLCLIDASHYGVEWLFVAYTTAYLRSVLKEQDITVEFETARPPEHLVTAPADTAETP